MISKSAFYRNATALCCLVLAQSGLAQEVELRSLDGLIRLKGEIVGYDGDKVQINSSLGVVEVPSRRMLCLTEGCPDDVAWAVTEKDVTVAIERSEYITMLDQLVQAYADRLGGRLLPSDQFAFSIEAENEVTKLNVDLAGANAIDQSDVAIRSYTADVEVEARFDNAIAWANDIQPARQVLALGALSVIVAPNVGIDAISLEDLARIYAGEISNWSELGGSDARIIPLKREPDSQAIRDFEELIMKPVALEIEPTVLTVGSDEQLVATINQFPGSVAVVDWSSAQSASSVALRGQCGETIEPSEFAIKSGDYPLLRAVVANSRGEIDFDMVPAVFDMAATSSWLSAPNWARFVDQTVTVGTPEKKSERLDKLISADFSDDDQEVARQFAETMFGSDRLSITFQDDFVTASIAGWNRVGLARLAMILQSGTYDNSEILFVGMSVREENPVAASRASALEVMDAFKTIAPQFASENGQGIELNSVGFGNIAPVSCHDGPFSSASGNRIEIWVRPRP